MSNPVVPQLDQRRRLFGAQSAVNVGGLGIAFGLTVLIGLYALTQQLDTVEDHRADWTESAALKNEQRYAAASEQRLQAAQVVCTTDHGPQVAAALIDPTSFACVNSRGRALSTHLENRDGR